MEKRFYSRKVKTPVGELKLIASDFGLSAVLWENDNPNRVKLVSQEATDNPHLEVAELQLLEYFAGHRQRFELPLDPHGTDFQKSVWKALLEIPYGETRSYGDIAKRIKNPKAVRAVGAANGRNPLSIIAPCHRVIGASGNLTGFAGGLEIKAFLLDLENRIHRNEI